MFLFADWITDPVMRRDTKAYYLWGGEAKITHCRLHILSVPEVKTERKGNTDSKNWRPASDFLIIYT